jgi:hypothetical protein
MKIYAVAKQLKVYKDGVLTLVFIDKNGCTVDIILNDELKEQLKKEVE